MSGAVQKIEALFDALPVEWEGGAELRRAIVDVVEDELISRAKCAHCGGVAVCFGRYESPGEPEPACDECCGHGNEDGWCVHFDDHEAVLKLVLRSHAFEQRQEEQIEQLSLTCRRMGDSIRGLKAGQQLRRDLDADRRSDETPPIDLAINAGVFKPEADS